MKISTDGWKTGAPSSLLALTLVFMITMIGWCGLITMWQHREHFRQETQLYERAVIFQTDRVMLRLKDVTGFIASGVEDRILEKVNSLLYLAPYIRSFGYVRSQDPSRETRVLGRRPVLDGTQRDDFARLMSRILVQESWVSTLGTRDFPRLFPNLADNEVVMVQALRTSPAATDFNVVYAVLDLKAAVADAGATMQHGRVASVAFDGPGEAIGWSFDEDSSLFAEIFPGAERDLSISVTRDFKLKVMLKEKMSGLGDLFVMIAGLALVTLLSAVLVFHHHRLGNRARARLSTALREARQASEAKSAFLANMSHEIRTPMNGVLGMVELLRRTELTETQRRYADQIRTSGGMLLSLLNDILDLSKIESGQLAIDPVRTRLPALVTDIVSFYGVAAHAKNIDLLIDIDPRLPEQVEADPTRVRQILSNLVSNALKFTPEGEVVVSARRRDDGSDRDRCSVEFSVRDTGIGVAAENVGKLFGRFNQAEASTTRVYGGTGLGLSICREICEMMGGTIGVESQPGRGSTFTFTLSFPVIEGPAEASRPAMRMALVSPSASLRQILSAGLPALGVDCETFEPTADIAERVVQAQGGVVPFDLLVVDEGRHIGQALKVKQLVHEHPDLKGLATTVLGKQQVDPRYAEFDQAVIKPFDTRSLAETVLRLAEAEERAGPRPASAKEERPAGLSFFHGKRALLVDDNNVNLLFGSEVLSGLGFQVVMAGDGPKAIELAQSQRFDIVLMDCQMPVMDGYEATRILRAQMADGTIARVPIVAVTANALKGDRERCLACGMDAFVTKPVSIPDLEATLEAVLRPGALRDAPAPAPEPAPAPQAIAVPAVPTVVPAPSASKDPAPAPVPVAEAARTPVLTAVPPAAPRQKTPLVDAALFARTRASMTKFDTLLSFYRTDTEQYLRTIAEALAAGRVEDAVMPAHTIKSSSRILGALGLALLAEEFEKRARLEGSADAAELNALRVHMERLFKLTLSAIDQLAQDRPAALIA